MGDIAAAKEVLTDEEMRQKYDQGEDPLTLKTAREAVEGDILSDRVVTLSTSQVDIPSEEGSSSSTSTSKFYGRFLHRYSGVSGVVRRQPDGTRAMAISGHSRRF